MFSFLFFCHNMRGTNSGKKSMFFKAYPLLPDGVPDKKTSRNSTRFLYSTLIYNNIQTKEVHHAQKENRKHSSDQWKQSY